MGGPDPGDRDRRLISRIGIFYVALFRTYRAWWARILPLAAVIFTPIALLDGVIERMADSLGPEDSEHVLAGFGVLFGTVLGAVSSLLGEVLLAGMISLTLAGSMTGNVPSIRWIAGRLKYGRLILLDITYGLIVIAGAVLLVVPGVVAYVMLGLAGPVVELEHRRIFAAFRRSAQLVRREFWLVFWVLTSIQFGTNRITSALEHLGVSLFGHHSLLTKLTEVLPEILLGPLFAIAAVLFTLRLSALDQDGPPDDPARPSSG